MSETKWINCPLCREPDMRAVYDEPDLPPVVTCTNLGCMSNTGTEKNYEATLDYYIHNLEPYQQHRMAERLASNVGYDLIEEGLSPEGQPTLRDLMAMEALTGTQLATLEAVKEGMETDDIAASIAKGAYQVADAMLKAREKL